MNITDLLFGGSGAPFMSMLANGRGPNPFSGRPSMPGLNTSGGNGPPTEDNMLTYGGEGVSGMDMGGAGAGGGMDWATLMQMMSRMGGMRGMGGGMSGMGGAGNAVMGGMGANMGGAQSPILQAMQAALAGMRGGGAQQPMSPINTLMRYR